MLQPYGRKSPTDCRWQLLNVLRESKGMLSLSDKSDPLLIRKLLNMSKSCVLPL